MKKQYYSMEKNGNEANINIYGDISSYEWSGSAMNVKSLSAVLEEMGDVSKINVYINSYGGEVAEGLAIYNALKRHKATVITHCDGFAASIASVIFMAGDERIMNESSLLMIHNSWTWAEGNAEQLRKLADDLDKITQASVNAYKAHSALSEDEIKELMNNETWILPEEALEYGFATSVTKTEKKGASQNAMQQLFEIVKKHRQATEETEDEEEKPDDAEDENEGENNEDETADGTDDEEKPDEEETEEDEEDGEQQNNASQKLSEFFNAILKM